MSRTASSLAEGGRADGAVAAAAPEGRPPRAVARRRAAAYGATALTLIGVYPLVHALGWRGGPGLHTLLEVVSATLALFVGVVALLRYYSRRDGGFLFIGSGFIGTALLDGFHALVTSVTVAGLLPSDLPRLVVWSWLASRIFLAVMLWLSLVARERMPGAAWALGERAVYLTGAALLVGTFVFFAFVPLPRADHPSIPFAHRPHELVAAAFFALALAGYLRRGRWRLGGFEHWLVLALVLGVAAQALFMPVSDALFDPSFNGAHVLKLGSYALVLVGLSVSMYRLFRRAEEGVREIRRANEELMAEIAERARAERERRQTERRLRDAEGRYRSLVERIPAIVYVAEFGEAGRWPYVSPQIQSLLGFSAREWMADPELWFRRIHPGDRERVMADEARSRSQGEPLSSEYRMVSRDGRVVWFRDEATVLTDEAGRPASLQGVMYDVTRLKAAEEALRKALERERHAAEHLRELDAMKSTFLRAVSHELRTPLATVLGVAATLERSDLAIPPEQARELVALIARNARRLDRLLSDLLDLDRLMQGIVEARRQPIDLAALVRRVARESGVADRPLHVEAETLVVSVDGAKVERIVHNLVANAARYTPPGTPIWVRVRPEAGGALILVEDAGPGVPDDLKEAIFEPFRHGPGSLTHAPGTGIGLSLVSRFAQLHGGTAWVEDRPEGGASFRVFLPSGPPEEPRAAADEGGARPAVPK